VKTGGSPDRATIVFHDNGDGIAPENLPKVFDPMFTTKLRGIGLGLTVVRRTVEEHGGKIDIRSTPELGTTVRIQLPFDYRSGPLVGHRRAPAATKVTAAPASDDNSG
jgi:signal transduction histidine kinase